MKTEALNETYRHKQTTPRPAPRGGEGVASQGVVTETVMLTRQTKSVQGGP